MKKAVFFIALSLIIYSCIINVPINLNGYCNNESKEEIIKKLEKQEFYSGEKNDQLFFGLSFGMNWQDVNKKLAGLKSENILENISTQYGILGASYTMNYREYSNCGRFYCFFNDNKLNELQIDTLNQNNNLLDLFIQKYGEANYIAENNENTEYHWIMGNQHLTIFKIENTNRLLIQFIDTTEKVKENNENILDKLGVCYKA